jgi:hypothetical protein
VPVRSTVSVAGCPRVMVGPERTDAVGPLMEIARGAEAVLPHAFVAVTVRKMLPEPCALNVDSADRPIRSICRSP